MTYLNPADFDRLQAYLDRQLTPEERAAFEARLTQEPDLATALAGEQRLRIGLRTRMRQTRAPASLRATLASSRSTSAAGRPWRLRWSNWWSTPRPVSPSLATAVLLLIFMVAALLGRWSGVDQPVVPAEDHTVFRQLAGKHAVYLQDSPVPLDVRGQPADVAAWFDPRLPFPVTIPTLTGWNLEGGRLGEYHHRPAAHLVYDRTGQHLSLTLFTPQETDFPPAARRQMEGHQFFAGDDGRHPVLLWQQEEVGYALVGDPALPAEELFSFALEIAPQLEPD